MTVPLQFCFHVHMFVLTLSEVKTQIWNHCVLVLFTHFPRGMTD